MNSMADLQANTALDLLLRLEAAASAPPSGYRAAASRLASLLELPGSEVARMEAADDFWAAAAAATARRCGVAAAAVVAAVRPAEGGKTDAAAAAEGPAHAAGGGSLAGPDVPRPLLYFTRRYSPQEGLAYAAAVQKGVPMGRLASLTFAPLEHPEPPRVDWAAAAAASAAGPPAGEAVAASSGAAAAAATQGANEEGPAEAAADGLPPELAALLFSDEGEEALTLTALLDSGAHIDASVTCPLPPIAGAAAAGSASPPARGAGIAAASGPAPAWLDPLATYVLQFDGASRNNPGRAAWGYVLLRGTDARARVAHGCMTLPYGTSAAAAEYIGLVKGLEAALASGVRKVVVEVSARFLLSFGVWCLVEGRRCQPASIQPTNHPLTRQGDSEFVIQQLLHRRGSSLRQGRSGGAQSVVSLFVRATQLLEELEEYELVAVPRWVLVMIWDVLGPVEAGRVSQAV
jgi:hypothetical protein